MVRKKWLILPLGWLGVAFLLAACDQQASSGHMLGGGMMSGGMMDGGMMGQPSRSNDVQTLPEPRSKDAQLFQRYCGQCHVPPAPSAHTTSDWPGVVARMKQHIVTQGKAMPDSEESQEILDYLQRNAG